MRLGNGDDGHGKRHECCRVIAASIAEIVRRSLNEDFRRRCFQILETSNTYGVEKNVNTLLMEITMAKYSRKLQKDTTKAEVSTDPTTNSAEKENNELTVTQNNPKGSLVPEDIDLEEIDNWD